MRALHVAAGNLYGGVERIIVEIAQARGTSWQHEIALCFEGRLLTELQEAGAVCHLIQPVRFSRPTTVWRARRHLRRVTADGRYDAVVCHSPWAFALAAPAVTGRRILWAHDALRGTHWTERRASRTLPDAVICNSRYTAEAVREWLSNVPIDVVYAPVAARPVGPEERAAVRRELHADERTTAILIACRFERWKGHVELLEAASMVKGDWTIWIAGGVQKPIEAALDQELQALAKQRGISDRVRFLGERRDVPRLLRAADVLCQPNTAPEPFGIAFVEAFHAGVPVVTTDAGGAREIVTPASGFLVPPGDRPALVRALQTLVDDPDRRRTMGSAGPARARELCDPFAQVAALERVLTPRRAEALA
jgi:glycosyltransferase involved in cell wall biosynthesis